MSIMISIISHKCEMLVKCFGVMVVTSLFAGLMILLATKYNERVCEIRYGAGENHTLQMILEHPLVKYAAMKTCSAARDLAGEEQLSLWEQIWEQIAPTEQQKYKSLARDMSKRCGEVVLRGMCCEHCVRYQLVVWS
jgi:hypothetical protein